jgi:hypothetical protein
MMIKSANISSSPLQATCPFILWTSMACLVMLMKVAAVASFSRRRFSSLDLDKGILCLGHHHIQGIAQRKCGSITLQIVLGGLVAPWPRWKCIHHRGFVFTIGGHRYTGFAILDTDQVGLKA